MGKTVRLDLWRWRMGKVIFVYVSNQENLYKWAENITLVTDRPMDRLTDAAKEHRWKAICLWSSPTCFSLFSSSLTLLLPPFFDNSPVSCNIPTQNILLVLVLVWVWVWVLVFVIVIGGFRIQGSGETPKMTFKNHFYHHISTQVSPLGSNKTILALISP